jgi:hypothetical protein
MPNEERAGDDPSPDTDRIEIKSIDEALGAGTKQTSSLLREAMRAASV